jgi:type VI protein secretion system component Hcp
MSRSNIFMQLVTGAGPVVGEGLLEGAEGSVELLEFGWGMKALKDPKSKGSGMAAVAAAAASMAGLGKAVSIKMEPLTFKKRFDVASSQMHFCLDNHLPIVSASITVLHIKQQGRAIHQPGFTLVCTMGHFASCKLEVSDDGLSKEVTEDWTLNFKSIKMMYLKTLGKDNLPTAPFFYPTALL